MAGLNDFCGGSVKHHFEVAERKHRLKHAGYFWIGPAVEKRKTIHCNNVRVAQVPALIVTVAFDSLCVSPKSLHNERLKALG